jgi:hypothetical protein
MSNSKKEQSLQNNNSCTLSIKKKDSYSSQFKSSINDTKKYKPLAFDELKVYENEILEKIEKENYFPSKNYEKDPLGDFIDRVIDRSLFIYKNRYNYLFIIRNCHTCSRLLTSGKSTNSCPKNHHIYRK